MTAKSLWRRMLPGFAIRAINHLRGRVSWQGDYVDWASAVQSAHGYDQPNILEQVSEAVQAVLRGDAAYERDSVLFREEEVNAPLQKAFAFIGRAPVTVVDFGGSLGSTYLQNRNWLLSYKPNWNVIEQPKFVEEGRRLFPSHEIRFETEAKVLSGLASPKVLILSSVLQYLSEPEATIGELLSDIDPEYIFLDRVSYWPGTRHRLTLQSVPAKIYKASYPCWFFSKPILEGCLDRYEKVFEFPALDECRDFSSTFEGSFWKRKGI